jgi:hypothetical protein
MFVLFWDFGLHKRGHDKFRISMLFSYWSYARIYFMELFEMESGKIIKINNRIF